MAVDAISSIFPVKPQTGGGLVDSAISTPQIAPAVKIAGVPGGDGSEAIATPPAFNAVVPTTMDATVGAGAFSEPNVLPNPILSEPKVFQMADGRFYNPSTGVSGATREEVLGVNAGVMEKPVEPVKPTTTAPVADDVTAAIKALFPESDSLVKQYDELRKSSGLVDLETQQEALNKEIADMNAVIQNVEEEVRAQAAGMADESFIQATVADRIRRLLPKINQLNARQSALTSSIESRKDNITEQLGLSRTDIQTAQEDRKNIRQGVFDLLDTYGSGAFVGVDPAIIAELEKRSGLPPGSISARSKTLEEKQMENIPPSEKYGSGVIGEYNFYSEQETKAGRTPLSFDEYQNRDANRKIAQVLSTGMTTQQSSQFLNVTNKFQADPLIAKAINATVLDSSMDAVIADPKAPTNQLNVLYGYIKALDPDSAVREGELALAQTAQSYLARFGNSITRLAEGRTIDPKLAVEMAKATKELAKARIEAARKKESFYRSQASGLGFGDEFGEYLSSIELPYTPERTSTTSGGGGGTTGGGTSSGGSGGEFDW